MTLATQRKRSANRFALPPRSTKDIVLLLILLALSAASFFINLTASGYANEFYSAAAQAGSKNWEAFLFGSLDAGNAITVDKPPASLWLMALSIRIFGLSSFAILLPQALMGVAVTYLLYATVRRYWGNAAGLIAGFVFILTPVANLMFRFNNPDALLVLLMLASCAATMRAMEYDTSKRGNRARTWWMVLAGTFAGFAFLTKQMQSFLILPGLAAAFLTASPTGWGRRILDSLAAIAALVVSAGWWVLLTIVVPAQDRPYIGGSQDNSFLNLTFGYNGFGRLTGDETGSVVPGSSSSTSRAGMWGQTGITRLFGSEFAGQITWFAFIAFAGIVIALIAIGRKSRLDLRRAMVLMWGGWLVVTWLTFSFMGGIFHAYYTVALAPAAAVLTAIATISLWEKRRSVWAPITAAVLVAGQSAWNCRLVLSGSWQTWIGWTGLILGILAAIGILIAGLGTPKELIGRIAVILSAIAVGIGPLSWTINTMMTGHHGSIVYAGPVSSMGGGRMGGGPGSMGGGFGGEMSNGAMSKPGFSGESGAFGAAPGGTPNGTSNGTSSSTGAPTPPTSSTSAGNPPAMPNGQGSSSNANGANGGMNNGTGTGNSGSAPTPPNSTEGFSRGGKMGGQMGGSLLNESNVSAKVVKMLEKDASKYRWVAATTGSQNAAGYQLASQDPVMAIGGFNGSDPYPTLTQFKEYVKKGLIHYYIASDGMGGGQMGGSQDASRIAAWVKANYTATTVDGVTIYDLTAKK